MSGTLSSWLLVFDGSGTPTLKKQKLTAHPGAPFLEPADTDKIYLASGFQGLHPDSTLQLSPTLQFNGDQTDLDDDTLAAIGLAELNRFNALRFRSYTLDADTGVIVLGTTTEQLRTFIDTYGGVLQITPLLTKGFSEEFDTILEPTVSSRNNRIYIQYLVRKPLDADTCILCGNCGPICPESCISEQLFLDLSRCTHCNECVKVCPTQTIDLHAIVRKTVEIPALLVLDGVQTELPQNSSRIFTPDSLEKLFATIFDCLIDDVVTCDRTICQYSGRLQTGCRRCLTSCTFGAISTTKEGIVINQQKCTECGHCVATCPTGAIQYLRFDDHTFIDYFSALDLSPGNTVVLGNESQLHKLWWFSSTRYNNTFFLEYPQVQALDSMHFLFLLARGVARIILLLPDSPDKELQDQISATNAIIEGLFDYAEPVLAANAHKLDALLQLKPGPLLAEPMREGSFANRREKLISILHYLLKASGRSIELKGEPFATFGRIKCDIDKCTLCLACLNECRMQALQSDEKDYSLNHRALACVQCGTCVQVCPENALKRMHSLTLDELAFRPKMLAKAEPMACKECGKIFGTKQSFERVMFILRRREADDNLELYEYCETCRVRKIYEAGQS